MFWSDWGEKPKIERAGMDGSGRIVLVHTHIHWPNGLTVNLDTSELYWVDAKLKIIDCINFDGRNRRTIVKAAHLKHPFSLTLYGGYLYWTDWLTRSINSCNKTNGSIVHTVLDNIHSPMGLVALMPDRQKQGAF